LGGRGELGRARSPKFSTSYMVRKADPRKDPAFDLAFPPQKGESEKPRIGVW